MDLKQLVPDAELDDGYFSVLILEEVNLAELAHVLTLAMRGDHLKHDKVKYFKSRESYIAPSFEEVQLNLDRVNSVVCYLHILKIYNKPLK